MTIQSLGAATLNEFKRTHKKSQTDMAAAAAAAAAVAEATEEAPSVTARLDLLLEKKRNAVLGPSKISTAESRGEREYQVRYRPCGLLVDSTFVCFCGLGRTHSLYHSSKGCDTFFFSIGFRTTVAA